MRIPLTVVVANVGERERIGRKSKRVYRRAVERAFAGTLEDTLATARTFYETRSAKRAELERTILAKFARESGE